MIPKDTLAEIILDFRAHPLPEAHARELEAPLAVPIKRAVTIIGPRRAGKTYYLFTLVRKLLDQGVKRERILYVNFEHPKLIGMSAPDLMRLLDVWHELSPENHAEKTWFFLDEIQNISGWEKFIRHCLDAGSAQVFLSGSSAKLLSKEIATALRGRTLSYLLLPFSFAEYGRTKGLAVKKYYASPERHAWISAWREYLTNGGYPEILLYPQGKGKIVQEIIDVTIQRDLIERYSIRNTKVIKLMFQSLVRGKEFSPHAFYRFLKSMNIRVSKNTLYNYLEYFSDALVFFPLRKFFHSLKKQEQSIAKVYCVDTVFIDEIMGDDRGKKLETAVFLSLLRQGYEPNKNLFYYSDGKEVDFVITEKGKVIRLIQVCEQLSDIDTKEREFSGLLAASRDLGCNNLSIVTTDEEGEEQWKGKTVTLVPAWKWLLRKDVPQV